MRLGNAFGFTEDAVITASRLRDAPGARGGRRFDIFRPLPPSTHPDLVEPLVDAAARAGVTDRTLRRAIEQRAEVERQTGRDEPGVHGWRRGRHEVVVLRAEVDAWIAARTALRAETSRRYVRDGYVQDVGSDDHAA